MKNIKILRGLLIALALLDMIDLIWSLSGILKDVKGARKCHMIKCPMN